MTDVELAAIEARVNAATAGKWVAETDTDSDDWGMSVTFVTGILAGAQHKTIIEICGMDNDADARFITHAREDVPALVAEVKTLQGCITDLHALAESNHATIDRLLSEVKALRELADTQAAIITAKNAEIAQMRGDYAGALLALAVLSGA